MGRNSPDSISRSPPLDHPHPYHIERRLWEDFFGQRVCSKQANDAHRDHQQVNDRWVFNRPLNHERQM